MPHGLVIGKVVAVVGSQVVATLVPDAGADGRKPRVEKGQLVKLRLPQTVAFGLVSGLSVPLPGAEGELHLAELVLLGECPLEREGACGQFRRGLSAYPALGDEVIEAGTADIERLYGSFGRQGLPLGTLHGTTSQLVWVDPDALLGRHFAIIGSTGCGKSCALAAILRSLVAVHQGARALVLDSHGEYGAAFADEAVVLGPDTLHLPYWMLNGKELVEVVCGRSREGPALQAADLLAELVPKAKRLYREGRGNDPLATVDTPVPYRLSDLERLIDEAVGRLEKPEGTAPYRWLRTRLGALTRDPRFAFMFGGIAVHDTMARTLGTIFRIPPSGKPLTIVDLSALPSEALSVVVSVLLRLAFDLAYWSGGRFPVLIVCEEAHRYAPADGGRGFNPTRAAIGRIAKEGRKYGIALGIVTQRPSEIEPTVLSQCNTLFAFRVTSPEDQELVQSLLRDDANGLLDFLPSLGDGEAIALGQAVPIPLRVRFPRLDERHRPRSSTPSFTAAWQEEGDAQASLETIVRAWRGR